MIEFVEEIRLVSLAAVAERADRFKELRRRGGPKFNATPARFTNGVLGHLSTPDV
jgi:hypothetical protein